MLSAGSFIEACGLSGWPDCNLF